MSGRRIERVLSVIELVKQLLSGTVTDRPAVLRGSDERPAEREGGTGEDIVGDLAVRGLRGSKAPPREVPDVKWLRGPGEKSSGKPGCLVQAEAWGSRKGLCFEATGPAYLRVWCLSSLEVGTERLIRYGHMLLEIKRLGSRLVADILLCRK
jgi:hypothetical protein